jgi:hypothetical protein
MKKLKMVDMKNPPPKKGGRTGLSVEYGGDEYPYGLQLSLRNESLKKLNLEPEDMVAGAEIDFCITVKVTATRMEAGQKDITSCDMQIMKMGEMPDADD